MLRTIQARTILIRSETSIRDRTAGEPFTLGTMRALGSVDQMHAVLQAAVLAGINHLETAPAYGPAEEFLGQACNVKDDSPMAAG